MIIETVKLVGGLASSIGVSAIVSNAVKAYTPAVAGKLMKVCIGVGSMAITGVVCKSTTTYVGTQVDTVAKYMKKITDKKKPEVTEEI